MVLKRSGLEDKEKKYPAYDIKKTVLDDIQVISFQISIKVISNYSIKISSVEFLKQEKVLPCFMY